MKETWVPTLRSSIRQSLVDISKGWFNLEESNWEVYHGSKLKKLMELTKFAMQVHVQCMYIHTCMYMATCMYVHKYSFLFLLHSVVVVGTYIYVGLFGNSLFNFGFHVNLIPSLNFDIPTYNCQHLCLSSQDSLRSLVLTSLSAFVQMTVDACSSTLELESNYKWGNNLMESPFQYV